MTSPAYILTHTYTHLCPRTFLHDCFYLTGLAKLKQGFSHLSSVLGKQMGTRDLASHTVSLRCLGNTYKYQAGNRMNALLWFKHLSAACQSNRQQVWSRIKTHTHAHTQTHTVSYILHTLTLYPGASQSDVIRVSDAEECD